MASQPIPASTNALADTGSSTLDDDRPTAQEIADGDNLTVDRSPFAHGAYADIYEGEWLPPGETEKIKVAVKILRLTGMNTTEEHQEALVRAGKHLGREVHVWQRLVHPHINPLLGYMHKFTKFVELDRPCLVSPLRPNGNLIVYLARNPKVDKLKLLYQTAEGLNHMHTLTPTPIAHLDIKPDNILIGDEGEAQICDFGISRVLDGIHTGFTTSTGVGYLPFLSPEILTDSLKTIAADVYAFGCLVLQTLSGKQPWWNQARGKTVILVAGGKTPSRSDYKIEAPPEVLEQIWTLLEHCWSFEPQGRPTMAEVVQRLLRIQEMVRECGPHNEGGL